MATASRATVTLRPFTQADYDVFVALSNEAYPEYQWTVDEVRFWDDDWKPEGFFRRRVIAEEAGVPVGYAEASHARGQFVPANYRVDLVVRPAVRRRGIGTVLFDDLVAALRPRGARWIRAQIKESDGASVAFAKAVGATELERHWESRLDLATFDPAPFASAEGRAAAAGVRFTTLAAEMGSDPDAMRKAFELHEATRVDVPSLDPPTPSPYDRFQHEVLRGPASVPDAYFIAIRDGRYVGESSLGKEGTDPGVIYQQLTAVSRDERGKGIAMAMKLRTIEYARVHGFREIRTWNASINRPMLAINEALGFAKQPAWINFGKELSID
jgi:GNAT superfamily N-acetyltransferase